MVTTFSPLQASEFDVLTIWRGVTTSSTHICDFPVVPFQRKREETRRKEKKNVRTVIFFPNVLALPFMSFASTLLPKFELKNTKTMRMLNHTSTACYCCTVVGLFELLLNISLKL